MKLDDFLKCKKVRCVSIGNYNFITVGKEYVVFGVDMDSVIIVNDADCEDSYPHKNFEPVLDSAENPLQDMKLTPEFEAVAPVLADNSINIQDIGTDILDTNADIKDAPKFKVGDKVYYSTDKEIYTISEIDSENSGLAYLSQNDDDWDTNAILKFCCHATPENHEMLCKLYPHIKFEPPSKPLMGIELAKAMLDKGWSGVYGIGGSPNVSSLPVGDCVVVTSFTECGVCLDYGMGLYQEFTPLDLRTGLPLTEFILND